MIILEEKHCWIKYEFINRHRYPKSAGFIIGFPMILIFGDIGISISFQMHSGLGTLQSDDAAADSSPAVAQSRAAPEEIASCMLLLDSCRELIMHLGAHAHQLRCQSDLVMSRKPRSAHSWCSPNECVHLASGRDVQCACFVFVL